MMETKLIDLALIAHGLIRESKRFKIVGFVDAAFLDRRN